jgi:hypothetical protein
MRVLRADTCIGDGDERSVRRERRRRRRRCRPWRFLIAWL